MNKKGKKKYVVVAVMSLDGDDMHAHIMSYALIKFITGLLSCFSGYFIILNPDIFCCLEIEDIEFLLFISSFPDGKLRKSAFPSYWSLLAKILMFSNIASITCPS
jgi:hypothetical protein